MRNANPAKRRQDILLMTATITPQDCPGLARVDPEQRLRDYEEALDFYLGMIGAPLDGIVFVENSDSDVSSLRALVERSGHADRVELIANYGQYRYPGRDRSYGEFKLLDHAMQHSALIAAAGDDAVVWKVSGRYRVRNLPVMVRTAPKAFDLYCDMRNRPTPWMDLRFMGWTKHGYRQIFAGIADILQGDTCEPGMYKYVPTRAEHAVIVPRYRSEPLVDGVRGWDNRHYFKGGARLKFYVRSAARRVLPGVWI